MAHPLLEAERQANSSQSWKARGNLGTRDSNLHQTVDRFQVPNQVFPGSWRVDICQEDYSLRSAPQRRYKAHLRQHSPSITRKLRGWDRECD